MSQTARQSVVLHNSEQYDFLGRNDENLRALQKKFGVKLLLKDGSLEIRGDQSRVDTAREAIEELLEAQRKTGRLSAQQFRTGMAHVARRNGHDPDFAPTHTNGHGNGRANGHGNGHGHHDGNGHGGNGRNGSNGNGHDKERLSEIFGDEIPVPLRGKRLSPLTPNQKRYVRAILENDITFGIGPAGTGKTYLAMAMAVNFLLTGKVSRIILCRPAVEAGERLGFLPGDLSAKFDPFVRPLWDALYGMVDSQTIRGYLDQGIIEIAPLAYMRGRTLNNAFVILDEGQNTSIEQMKMFLTRLGMESKGVVTGDPTQIDLPQSQRSGLHHVQRILRDIKGIQFIQFEQNDVVRNDIVMKIIRAYESHSAQEDDYAPGSRL